MDDRRDKGTSQFDSKYLDFYAKLTDGVREVSIGARSPTDNRFAIAMAVVIAAFAAVTVCAIVLAFIGYPYLAAGLVALTLLVGTALVALVRIDAQNREESANESSIDGVGSASQNSTGRIED